MEEEKRKKRVKREETPSSPLPHKYKKTAYTVLIVTPNKVIYEISKGNNSRTPNIWGTQLKVGDQIYLDEQWQSFV